MSKQRTTLEGWARFPREKGEVLAPNSVSQLSNIIKTSENCIARGNARSYGDSSFSQTGTISMLGLNRLLAFDPQTGCLEAESGVLLSDIISCVLPKGWFPPVSPGTKFVTLGGMIASNVHGKNAVCDGAFGDHVLSLELVQRNGERVSCSSTQNPQLFYDTIGGMGLTGVIIKARVRLKRVATGWMKQQRSAHSNLESVLAAFEGSENSTYRVAWIDVLARGKSLGRSILDIAEHASVEDLPREARDQPYRVPSKPALNVPIAPPITPLNKWTVKLFNMVHYHKGRKSEGTSLVDWNSYFYPLDSIHNWNRIYGRRGFAQYQCVLPKPSASDGLEKMLDLISSSGKGSFLAVLKRLGPTIGSISFPTDGYTLALDFPWSNSTAQLLQKLDDITTNYGGRIYLAKDSRVAASTFHTMQPDVGAFTDRRRRSGSKARFNSSQSRRIEL